MLLIPIIKLLSNFSDKKNLYSRVVLGLLLGSLVFILFEKIEMKILEPHSNSNLFLNQMELVNKELFGNLLNNPLIIVGFIMVLNILLITCVYNAFQNNKAKLFIKNRNDCEMINKCPFNFFNKTCSNNDLFEKLIEPEIENDNLNKTINNVINTKENKNTEELLNKMKETVEGLLDGIDLDQCTNACASSCSKDCQKEKEKTQNLGKEKEQEKPKVKVEMKTNLNMNDKINLDKVENLVNDFVIPELLPTLLGDNIGDLIKNMNL